MLRNYYATLAGLLLLSHSASAVQADQQWGDWYGNISAMEFELNTQNASGEVLTLTCTSGKPGRGHWDTAHAIARDFLIRPETVLAIVHSRFSNAHTHPMPKAVKAKPEKPQTMRRLLSADLDQMHKLERFGWKQTEIAGELGISAEAVAHVLRLMRSKWSYPDILEDVNTRFGAK